MASRNQTSGAGILPSAIGGRNLVSVLSRSSQLTADNREAIYVAPMGGGLHLVKNVCNEQAYQVASLAGASFTPGQVVLLSSPNGAGGELIIGTRSGLSGASEFPVQISVSSHTVNSIPRPKACPSTNILGHNYIGIFQTIPGTWYAYNYHDGSLGSLIASFDFSATIGSGIIQRYSSKKLVSAGNGILTWDIESNSMAWASIASDYSPNFSIVGDNVFFYRFWTDGLGSHVQLHFVPVGFDGAIDLTASKIGSEFVDSTSSVSITGDPISYYGSSRFMIPCASIQKILYFESGSWKLISKTDQIDSGGYGVSWRDRSIFCDSTISIIGSKDRKIVELVPSVSWHVNGAGVPSIAGSSLVAYPFVLSTDATDKFTFRCNPQLQSFDGSCPIPRFVVDKVSGVSPDYIVPLD